MTPVEIFAQGKKFIAKTLEEVDQVLSYFKGWKTKKPKCLLCQTKLKKQEEYLCDKCYSEQMKREMESQKDLEQAEEEAEDWDIGWRFNDGCGRSVFKRE